MKRRTKMFVLVSVILFGVLGALGAKAIFAIAEGAAFLSSKTRALSLSHAVRLYAEHNESKLKRSEWPDKLIEHGLIEPTLLITHRDDGDGEHYYYLDQYEQGDAHSIMLFEDPDHWEQGVIVAFGDAHVEVLTHEEFELP